MAARLKWGSTPRGQGWLPIAPKRVPSFEVMFEDIGARPSALGEHLGVGMSSVYRWLGGQAPVPRAALLAMFYETKWGRDFVSCEVEWDAVRLGHALMRATAEVERLRAELHRLGRLADFGSANDPCPLVPRRWECRQAARQVEGWWMGQPVAQRRAG